MHQTDVSLLKLVVRLFFSGWLKLMVPLPFWDIINVPNCTIVKLRSWPLIGPKFYFLERNQTQSGTANLRRREYNLGHFTTIMLSTLRWHWYEFSESLKKFNSHCIKGLMHYISDEASTLCFSFFLSFFILIQSFA